MFSRYCIIIIGIIICLILFVKIISRKKLRLNNSRDYQLNWVSDVTKMDARPMDKIFYVKSVKDVQDVIQSAKDASKKISIAGQRHSMGGHTITENGYLVDMKYMDRILHFDPNKHRITIEPGIMWSYLIKFLNRHGMSPMTLQSYSTFSVGGSISVNAHGITNDYGIVESVLGIKLINHTGDIIYCSRRVNAKLFSLVIGGYGLFGIIVEVTLKVVPNCSLKMIDANLVMDTFWVEYLKAVDNPNINIRLGRINITNFDEIYLYIFDEISTNVVSVLKQNPNEMSKGSQLMYKWLMPYRFGQKIRYTLEKLAGKPLDLNNNYDRNELLYETATPMANLYNPIITLDCTHVLQEYFIPIDSFLEWMLHIKRFFHKRLFNKISLLNITIRFVKKDNTTFLSYAKKDMFAFVFYYRIERDEEADSELEMVHYTLTNIALKLGGTFYLPYRHHYSANQLMSAYPEIIDFFAAKQVYDPDKLFTNMWYEHYNSAVKASSSVLANAITPAIAGTSYG